MSNKCLYCIVVLCFVLSCQCPVNLTNLCGIPRSSSTADGSMTKFGTEEFHCFVQLSEYMMSFGVPIYILCKTLQFKFRCLHRRGWSATRRWVPTTLVNYWNFPFSLVFNWKVSFRWKILFPFLAWFFRNFYYEVF